MRSIPSMLLTIMITLYLVGCGGANARQDSQAGGFEGVLQERVVEALEAQAEGASSFYLVAVTLRRNGHEAHLLILPRAYDGNNPPRDEEMVEMVLFRSGYNYYVGGRVIDDHVVNLEIDMDDYLG